MTLNLFHFHQVHDLGQHAAQCRCIFVLHRLVHTAQTKRLDRGFMPLGIANRALDQRYPDNLNLGR